MPTSLPVHAIPALYHLPGLYEPFSAISHLLGAVMFLLAGLSLLRHTGAGGARRVFVGVYVFSGVLLMAVSGVYHMTVTGGMSHAVMLRLDHSAIFILIAGTFTPVHGLLFRGGMRWAPLLLIWTIAVGGIVLKFAFIERVADWVSLTLYLTMGWFGTAAGIVLWRRHGFGFIRPLLFGGIAYSTGALMEFCGWPVVVPRLIHAHEVFHVAVLVGAALHFVFIWRIAAKTTRGRDDAQMSSLAACSS
jgi:channel protein (hemolysin III family)